jgi:hypothetical protein
MSLRLAEQYNASLAGEVSPEQSVQTLQSELQQIIAQGQVVGYRNYLLGCNDQRPIEFSR